MSKLSRRSFLASTAAGALLGSSRMAFPEGEAKRPNILFIFSDDHAQQAISAYGSRINQTPHIDRIASEGVIFMHNTCGNSICAPSRATVLTGKHSHANGLRTNVDVFNGDQVTFPKLLHDAGYATALVGKWHLQKSTPQGFDYWEVVPGQGHYYNPDFINEQGKHRIEGYATDIITDLSINWLDKQRDPNKPFLLMCQHKAPHRSWAPGPAHLDMHRGETIPEPPTLFDNYANRAPVFAENEAQIGKHMTYDNDLKVPGLGIPDALGRDTKSDEVARMTPAQRERWEAAYRDENEAFKRSMPTGDDLVRWKYQRYIKDYLRCIASVDDSVGRLLAYLDQKGLAENTIVVYGSDQGFYLGEHGIYDKRWMYRESLAMPMVLRWPGHAQPGTKVEQLTQNIDYAPTFLAAAGITPPPDMQGCSMINLIEGEAPTDWRDAIYYHYYEKGEHHVPPHEGVSALKLKLIHYYEQDQWELFDLEKDPMEMASVYNSPEYAGSVIEMKQKLTELKMKYQVPPEDCIPSGK